MQVEGDEVTVVGCWMCVCVWCAGGGVDEVDGEMKTDEDTPPQSELALAGATVYDIISNHFPGLIRYRTYMYLPYSHTLTHTLITTSQ